MKQLIYLLTTLVVCAGCNDASEFYTKLDGHPEVVTNYKPVYRIGDTLTIKGRLNPESNLEIRIGEVKAELLSITVEKVLNNQEGLVLDVARVRITEEMGIGENRPVAITSGGATVVAPAIEIVGDADVALLDTQLELLKVVDIPPGAAPVHFRGQTGNTYLWSSTGMALLKADASKGTIDEVFAESALADDRGLFTIEEFYAGAVSPDERYFYFSAKVRESDQERTIEIFKLCRFDLQSEAFVTLNRTEYSLLRSRRTLAAVQPFEGPVNEVKIFKVTALYPDADGNLYCDLMGDFLTRLDSDGNYSYWVNLSDLSGFSARPNTETDFIPLINDADANEYYSSVRIHQVFPGVKLNYGLTYIDPEALVGYTNTYSGGRSALTVTDLVSMIRTGTYTNNYPEDGEEHYATASLQRFNGVLVSHLDPLPRGRKLLGLYFQTTENRIITGGVLCEIDLETQRTIRYAPEELLFNGFSLAESVDQLLSCDAEGMLYLTANNGTAIVKTAFKP